MHVENVHSHHFCHKQAKLSRGKLFLRMSWMCSVWTARMSLVTVLFWMRLPHQVRPSCIGHILPALIWNRIIIQMHRRAQRRLWLQDETPDTLTQTHCHPIHSPMDHKRPSSRSVAAELVKLAMLLLLVRVVARTHLRQPRRQQNRDGEEKLLHVGRLRWPTCSGFWGLKHRCFPGGPKCKI